MKAKLSHEREGRGGARGRLLLIAAVGGFALFVVCGAALYYVLNAKGARHAPAILNISYGSSARSVGRQLEARDVIASSHLVRLALVWSRLFHRESLTLKAGEYRIAPEASVMEILRQMHDGRVLLHKITFPEGWSSFQIAEMIRQSPLLEGELPETPPEGSLLPETWLLPRGASRRELARHLRQRRDEALDALWKKRGPLLPFSTPREAVILASIVEKETGLPQERGRVAAVFINRLTRGMKLEADSTVIYGITKGRRKLDRPLWTKDLRRKNPYNTYLIKGLPPTPIANPGADALAAALNPPFSEELYFVADGTGGHRFAKTLEEHQKNVLAWRQWQKEAARKRSVVGARRAAETKD